MRCCRPLNKEADNFNLDSVNFRLRSITSADIDECRTSNECRFNQVCINSPGGYSCTCPRGFRSAGPSSPCVGEYFNLEFLVSRSDLEERSKSVLCRTDRKECLCSCEC
jgi:Calcium-binding EGF domain